MGILLGIVYAIKFQLPEPVEYLGKDCAKVIELTAEQQLIIDKVLTLKSETVLGYKITF